MGTTAYKLKRLLYECECGVISHSLDEYAKHAHSEMVGETHHSRYADPGKLPGDDIPPPDLDGGIGEQPR